LAAQHIQSYRKVAFSLWRYIAVDGVIQSMEIYCRRLRQ